MCEIILAIIELKKVLLNPIHSTVLQSSMQQEIYKLIWATKNLWETFIK
ncbi:hypothetical protein [Buchnera aphidicola]|nr:hypothetical protein [Buchnera aphidicola]